MYPRIGIRPVIDGRQFGVREDLEEQTMNMAYAAKNLIESNLRCNTLLVLRQRDHGSEPADHQGSVGL